MMTKNHHQERDQFEMITIDDLVSYVSYEIDSTVIIITSIRDSRYENVFLYLQIAILIFLLVSVFMRFKLTIDEDYITYQIILFTRPIYKKELERNQIDQIKFIRVGWAQKGAIIQLKKGFNIRIVHFEPQNVYTDLIDFSNKTSIKIFKTKDYLIIEKAKIVPLCRTFLKHYSLR